MNTETFRFVIAGGLNTILTYIIYLLLLTFLTYQIAYSATYILGIIIGYSLNTLIVFRKPWKLKKMLQFPLVYLVQYLLGLMLISVLVVYVSMNQKVAPLLVVILLLPVTFFMSKFVINRS